MHRSSHPGSGREVCRREALLANLPATPGRAGRRQRKPGGLRRVSIRRVRHAWKFEILREAIARDRACARLAPNDLIQITCPCSQRGFSAAWARYAPEASQGSGCAWAGRDWWRAGARLSRMCRGRRTCRAGRGAPGLPSCRTLTPPHV